MLDSPGARHHNIIQRVYTTWTSFLSPSASPNKFSNALNWILFMQTNYCYNFFSSHNSARVVSRSPLKGGFYMVRLHHHSYMFTFLTSFVVCRRWTRHVATLATETPHGRLADAKSNLTTIETPVGSESFYICIVKAFLLLGSPLKLLSVN